MKKFNISSRGWVMIALAGLILMFGAVKVVRDGQQQTQPAVAGETEVPLNTLIDDPPPPMPDETPLVGGELLPSGSGGFPVPDRPRPGETPVLGPGSEPARHPVVWVSEEGASAYTQPGFNMPKLRPLEKWEELQLVENSTEPAWDRVRDAEGNEFWVQKKIITVIRPQNLSQPSVAEQKVMAFYTQVAEGEHSDAYTLLSPEWKRELSFDDFVVGYSRTDSLRSEITNVYEIGEERFQVDVSMEAVEEGEPIDYLGIYTVEKVDGKWFLTSGSLKRQVRAL
jgi:hypothetical protein